MRKVMLARGRYTCPCCGYQGLLSRAYRTLKQASAAQGLAPPYSKHFGDPSDDVCDCCGFEFGSDDEPNKGSPVSFEEYRKQWMKSGCLWFTPEKRPANWQIRPQLEKAELKA
jgi:hypothetical protein